MHLHPQKHISRILEEEAFEPILHWGFRMAFSVIIPIIWGIATGHIVEASWITLTAESICWMELKGSFGQRLRMLLLGIVLVLIFSTLGSITGSNLPLSLVTMLAVGFIAGMFKNIGDRGSGLAISVYVLFLLSNAYPTLNLDELIHRLLLTAIGGLLTLFLGLISIYILPAQQHYRQTIALIWKSNASLASSIGKGWDGKSVRNNIRNIYLKEREVRTAIDNSFHFYEKMASHVNELKDQEQFQLAQLRKTTALVATNLLTLSDELENIKITEVPVNLRFKLFDIFKNLEDTFQQIARYVVLVRPEEELLVANRTLKLAKSIELFKSQEQEVGQEFKQQFQRIYQLLERNMKFIESVPERINFFHMEQPLYLGYSLLKTMYVLHPKHWWKNINLLFNFNSVTFKYALRTAFSATIALCIYKWFNINHGYWIPFTVIIVLQPYFGATLKRGIDRVLGTILGGVVGGILVFTPSHYFIKEFMLFASSILMVYFIKKRYSVAAFFVTISLVILFDVEENVSLILIGTRALATISGAIIAIVAGFALLPAWDKKYLPRHIKAAIIANYSYFNSAFSKPENVNWIELKRNAETQNSIAFDSFNRYIQEPSIGIKNYIPYYQLITHCVRITRELNNIFIGIEKLNTDNKIDAVIDTKNLLTNCQTYFFDCLKIIQTDENLNSENVQENEFKINWVSLSATEILYAEKLLLELKSMLNDLQDMKKTGLI